MLTLKLRRELAEHDVFTVVEMGWSGKSNGELLGLAQNFFDVFLTLDRNIVYQQNVAAFQIAVVMLRAKVANLI